MEWRTNIARFERTSREEYLDKLLAFKACPLLVGKFIPWERLALPTRATKGSAGYDFYMPVSVVLDKDNPRVAFPTGIRCSMREGWVLLLFPKSGLGNRYGMGLENTTGVIDSDYYSPLSEGHIMAQIFIKPELLKDGEKFTLMKGDKFMQGVFLPHGTAVETPPEEERTGGFGSTGR